MDSASAMDEGKLERLDFRHAARREARQGPDDVDDAVAHLVEELGRLAAKLHGPERLDFQLTAGILLDLLRPRNEEGLARVGDRRNEGVHAQGDFLRHRGTGAHGESGDRGTGKRGGFHDVSDHFDLPEECMCAGRYSGPVVMDAPAHAGRCVWRYSSAFVSRCIRQKSDFFRAIGIAGRCSRTIRAGQG